MNPEEREMLERLLKISEHNNRILRVMRREVLWSRFFKVFYLIAIIAISYAIYYYLQPYLGNLDSAMQIIEKAKNSIPQ